MKIITVNKDSLGEVLGLKPGDRLLKINKKKVRDEIDYRFRICEENIDLELQIDGKRQVVSIEKEYDDDLGVVFEEFNIRSCANDCVFCFVDQNPEGMRKGMYFRDGDFRLSYLHGHYVTMTNMGQEELDRIVKQRLSPLYISVHATDVELRKKLLLYGKDDKLLDKIKFLTDNSIELHAQIVLMPGLNDGANMLKTIDDLHFYYPGLNSLTIVPIGLTKHRDGLMKIDSVTPEYAKVLMGQLDALNKKFRTDTKRPFIFFSDEWYILAGQELPDSNFYKPLDLVENGVGQVSAFLDDFEKKRGKLPESFLEPTEFSIVTGTLIEGIFKEKIMPTLNSIDNLKVNLYPIVNNFYGDIVTVTGLLSGKDIIEQLSEKQLGQAVWTSYRVLNDEGTLTIDDMTTKQISEQIGVPFNVSRDSVYDIFKKGISG